MQGWTLVLCQRPTPKCVSVQTAEWIGNSGLLLPSITTAPVNTPAPPPPHGCPAKCSSDGTRSGWQVQESGSLADV
jgi:hypothetical protein